MDSVLRPAGPRLNVTNHEEERVHTGGLQWWKRKASTLFIDNIPLFYDRFLLKKLFIGMGRIAEVHLPWKKREKLNTRYGFVIFEREEEAEKAVKTMNGIVIFGHKIALKMCYNGGKYFSKGKGEERVPADHEKQQWRREGVSYAQVVGNKNMQWKKKDNYREEDKASAATSNHSKKETVLTMEEFKKIQLEQNSKMMDIEALCLSLKSDLKFLIDKFKEICEEDSLEEDGNQKENSDKQEEEGENDSALNKEELSSVPDSLGEAAGFIQQNEGVGRNKTSHKKGDVSVTNDNEDISSRTVSLEPELGKECLSKTSRVAKGKAVEEACKTVEVGKKVGVTFDHNISSAIEKLLEMDT